jgi:hypothetical protein
LKNPKDNFLKSGYLNAEVIGVITFQKMRLSYVFQEKGSPGLERKEDRRNSINTKIGETSNVRPSSVVDPKIATKEEVIPQKEQAVPQKEQGAPHKEIEV